MESRAKFLGHPLHQQLIAFAWVLGMAAIFDVIRLVTGNAVWSEAAFYMVGAGIVSGLLAAVFGAIDRFAIPSPKRVGAFHGLGNVLVVLLFAVSFALRWNAPAAAPGLAYVLGFVSLGLALVTSWLGGELVYRLGVGVDDDAHLNAPSPLKSRSAAGPRAHRRAA